MYLKAYGKGIFRAAGGICAAVFAALLLVYSRDSRDGAAEGIEMCLKTLVPSLFPFMAAVNLMINTGVCARLGKALEKPSRLVFGLSGKTAPLFLAAMLGGYPVGAAGIGALFSRGELSEDEAKRAALFCVGAGPGFLISFVGGGLYSCPRLGVYLLISQTASALILGFASKLLYRGEFDISAKETKSAPLPFSQALTGAVYSASRAMAAIMGFVVIFCSALSVLKGIIGSKGVLTALTLSLEVCTACRTLCSRLPLDAVSFALGFGGLCVHFQIFSALGKIRVNKLLFFSFRIMQGLLTALFTRLCLNLFPVTVQVFSTKSAASGEVFGGSVFSGAMLVAVAVSFLITVRQNLNRTTNH